DFLSGVRERAAATCATAYVPGTGGEDWQYGFEAERLLDHDTIRLGPVTLTARHTPGHTPQHLCYLVTDGAFADEPGYILTGDFVFSGDLGRPDLLDEAVGMEDTRFTGAKQLFASLRSVFLTLPDHVQVFPGHGAGSACGKAIGSLPSTTGGYERNFAWWAPPLRHDDEQGCMHELLDVRPVCLTVPGHVQAFPRHGAGSACGQAIGSPPAATVGYERHFAWWAPPLRHDDEQGFIDELLDGQPDAHAYFARMKRQKQEGH